MQTFKSGLKFSCLNAVKANKMKIIITLAIILIGICTGVFVAIKSNNSCNLSRLQDISLANFYSGFVLSTSAFFMRYLSLCINLAIITGIACVPKLFPLSWVLYAYRAYLFGLNFALIFIIYGIGSAFTAIIIVLPCQLVTLFAMLIYQIILTQIIINQRRYGSCEISKPLFILLGFALFFIINLAETLLLFLLNGKVIMII